MICQKSSGITALSLLYYVDNKLRLCYNLVKYNKNILSLGGIRMGVLFALLYLSGLCVTYLSVLAKLGTNYDGIDFLFLVILSMLIYFYNSKAKEENSLYFREWVEVIGLISFLLYFVVILCYPLPDLLVNLSLVMLSGFIAQYYMERYCNGTLEFGIMTGILYVLGIYQFYCVIPAIGQTTSSYLSLVPYVVTIILISIMGGVAEKIYRDYLKEKNVSRLSEKNNEKG